MNVYEKITYNPLVKEVTMQNAADKMIHLIRV